LYAAAGIGLAATQVDVHQRVIVIDVSAEHNQPLVLINRRSSPREGGEHRGRVSVGAGEFSMK